MTIFLILILRTFLIYKTIVVSKLLLKDYHSLVYIVICLIVLPWLYFEWKNKIKKNKEIPQKKKKLFYLFILEILLITLFIYCVGTFLANIRSNYLTFKLNDKKELAVIKKYGDNLICAPFIRNTKKVNRSFYIIKFSENNNIKFKFEKIGPLVSEDVPSK